jgi:hypothetical protein
LSSLNAILNAQPHNRFSKILIRSGTISSFRAVHDFCESTRMEWPHPDGRPDFATFQFSDAYQEFYLSVFFHDRNELHSHAAVLSEDETAFGDQDAPAPKPGDDKEQLMVGADPCGADQPSPAVVPLMRLYFPREIAQLRDAYQQNVKIQSAADGVKNPPQNGLSLSLSVSGNDDDSVAAYAPLQTPLSQESILQGIVAALRRQHAKVVIIRATDPLDMIFLSRYLRQNYPQARLVTVGADLLMVHDFYDPRFHGILAVTTYPIVAGIRFPTWPPDAKKSGGLTGNDGSDEVVRVFPDSYSVGDFNALQSLLSSNADEHPEKLPAASYAQFGLPSFLRADTGPWRAHLWLTTVGRDGYWPVSVLDDVPREKLQEIAQEIKEKTQKELKEPELSIRAVQAVPEPEPISDFSVHFSVGWTILWMSAFILTVFVAFLLAFPHTFSRSEILMRFGDSHSPARNGLLFTGSMLLLVTQTLFIFPVVIWFTRFGQVGYDASRWECVSEALNGMWLVMICYIFSAVWLGAACYKGFKKRGHQVLAWAGITICFAAGIIALVSTWWGRWDALDSGLGNFVYRYISVGSGVSPLLPLLFLLAAWIWWCWQSLTGIASTEQKHMVLPAASDFDQESPPDAEVLTEAPVPDASDRVRLKTLATKEGEWPWGTLATMVLDWEIMVCAFVGLAVVLLLMRPSEIAEAFESPTYKWMYWISLYSCLLLVCHLIVHIVELWLQYRILLRAIERMPFRRGFSDLKTLTWKPLWKLAGNGTQDFIQLLGGELDALTQIENSGIRDRNLVKAIREAEKAKEQLSAEYEKIINEMDAGLMARMATQMRKAFQWFRPAPPYAAVKGPEAGRMTVCQIQKLFRDLQTKLAHAASEALIYATGQWKQERYIPPATKSDTADGPGKEPPARDPITRAVEHFLCLFYLNVILVPLRRLQTLILSLAGVFVFVLISYSSYPFESRESFHVLLISIFFVISLVVGIVYGQMYANPLLSRITNTKPGELGLDFWVRLGTFVFVPFLSLLSVQFPEINNFLFSWLEPALPSIK